ncbi:MAG: glycine cleavage T C-terminal barrel domain-containing protein [bacterium]
MNLEGYTKAHKSLALFDGSGYFGRVKATGQDAIDLLHRMSTNDLLPLIDKPGFGAQTVLTTEKGRIVDLLTVLSEGRNATLLTGHAREQYVIDWLDKFVIMEDAKFENATSSISHFLIFGPRALDFLQGFVPNGLKELMNFHSIEIEIVGVKVKLQKTHRIIESGWAMLVEATNSKMVWDELQARINEKGGTVIDEDTYNLLRIEAGIPASPNELNEKHNPLETTLVQAISWTKGCYIGQEVIARLDTYDKVQRHLMGIEIEKEYNIASLPSPIATIDGEHIGDVTSIAYSPALEKYIGLAFIKTAFAIPGISVNVGVEKSGATIVKLPFEII